MQKIAVVGSLNMDCVIETPAMPKAGETIAGRSVAQVPGGKGANQAYAIAKLGGDVQMIGAVGTDSCGIILKGLRFWKERALDKRSSPWMTREKIPLSSLRVPMALYQRK